MAGENVNTGSDFASAARDAARDTADAARNQWDNPDSALNRGTTAAKDQWQREDSTLNKVWDWTKDGISKQFKDESGNFSWLQTGAALLMGFVASSFWKNNVTGQPPGLVSIQFGTLLALGVATTAALGHLGAARGAADLGRDLVGSETSDNVTRTAAIPASYQLPDEPEFE